MAHERLGSEGDPNAPHNRPKFDKPAPPTAAASEGLGLSPGGNTVAGSRGLAPGAAAKQVLALAAAAAAAAVSRPRRARQLPRHLAEDLGVGEGAEDSPSRSVAGKVRGGSRVDWGGLIFFFFRGGEGSGREECVGGWGERCWVGACTLGGEDYAIRFRLQPLSATCYTPHIYGMFVLLVPPPRNPLLADHDIALSSAAQHSIAAV